MAEGKEIVIRIVKDAKEETAKKTDSTGDKSKKPTDDAEDNFLGVLIYRAAKQLKGTIISEIKYQQNKYYSLQDDYLGQQNMEIALNVVEKVWSVGLNIYTGAKLGYKLGSGYGAVAGAVIAAGVSTVQTYQQVAHNYEQERIKLNQMQAQLDFTRQRAGYSLTAGSIGENR